jgi:F420-0:gamma-glutamyl ligase
VQLEQGTVGIGIDGVVSVRSSDALRDCIDRNLAFKPKQVKEVIDELSTRLAVELFMRRACSNLQDHQVHLSSPMPQQQ